MILESVYLNPSFEKGLGCGWVGEDVGSIIVL